MIVIAVVAALIGAAASQTVPIAPATAGGAIKGRVVRADGRAMARARVRLTNTSVTPPKSRSAESDADGGYEFTDLEAGMYTVAASKLGYAEIEFGQRRVPGRGQPIALAAGETRRYIDIVMPRPGAIVGRVVDEHSDPVEGAAVNVLELRFVGWRQRLVQVASFGGRTNDEGRFRIFGLKPGRYYVSATVNQTEMVPSNLDLPGYSPTFFPGTPDVAEAQPIVVGFSQDAVGIDFSLVPTRTARVRGVAFNADGTPIRGDSVWSGASARERRPLPLERVSARTARSSSRTSRRAST